MSRKNPAAAMMIALLLAACSDGSSPSGGGNGGSSVTEAEARQLGGDVVLDVGEMVEVSSFDPITGISMSPPAPSGGSSHQGPPPPCVAVSPMPPVNSDGDIVPDSMRLDFSGCVFTHHMGEVTDSLDGTIDFVDPVPLATSHGVRYVFTDFTRARINLVFPARSFLAVHNGSREWGASPDTLGHTITGFTTEWTHASGLTTTHTKDWVGRFVATTAGTILPGIPLPAGSWTVAGSSAWARDTRTWSVVVSTTSPLAYDPSCQVPPRITSGSLHLVVTRVGVVTDVDIAFTACGQYTVTRTPAS